MISHHISFQRRKSILTGMGADEEEEEEAQPPPKKNRKLIPGKEEVPVGGGIVYAGAVMSIYCITSCL